MFSSSRARGESFEGGKRRVKDVGCRVDSGGWIMQYVRKGDSDTIGGGCKTKRETWGLDAGREG